MKLRDRKKNPDVLVFAEDPGAANYAAEIPAMLAGRGYGGKLIARGAAVKYLSERRISFEEAEFPASVIMKKERPRLVVSGTSVNPDTLGLALISEARSVGVTSAGAVDARANAGYRFRGRTDNPLAFAPDWLMVPDGYTKKEFVSLGYPPGRARVCGHPHYDYVRDVGRVLSKTGRVELRQALFPDAGVRPVIVFISEPRGGPNPKEDTVSAEYTLSGRGGSTRRTDIVLEEFLDAARLTKPKPYLVLRLHPRDKLEEFARYIEEFDMVSSSGPPLEMVCASDIVVGMTSMLLLEAAIIGRPALSVLPRASEKEWLPLVAEGVIPSVTDRAGLIKAMGDLLEYPGRKEGMALRGLVFNSKRRVLDFLISLLEGSKGGRRNGRVSGD